MLTYDLKMQGQDLLWEENKQNQEKMHRLQKKIYEEAKTRYQTNAFVSFELIQNDACATIFRNKESYETYIGEENVNQASYGTQVTNCIDLLNELKKIIKEEEK